MNSLKDINNIEKFLKQPNRMSEEELNLPQVNRAATEDSPVPRRERAATEDSPVPRRERAATEDTPVPRRERAATEDSPVPRRERAATEDTPVPRRERAATEDSPVPRRERAATEDSPVPRRERAATEDTPVPRRPTDSKFRQVLDRVHSAPEPDTVYRNAPTLTVLRGESGRLYKVKGVLSNQGGEAVILRCSDDEGNDVVAKVFVRAEGKGQHSLEARERVFAFMQTEAGRRTVLAVSDFGTVEMQAGFANYFEIMPFCPQGDMLGAKLTFDELVPVIGQLNESLHAIHQAGILHLDIKPDNLYHMDGRIVIGDFGIARTTDKAHTYSAPGTDGYRAPETVLAPTAGKAAYILGPYCDYYSLGVTLACLYEGGFIFEGVDPAVVTQAVMSSHMPLSYHDDPRQEQLEKLIDGLVRYDKTRRFNYEDVANWLKDHNYTGARTDDAWPRPFTFRRKALRDEQQLFTAMTESPESWEVAKEFLYDQTFESFFRAINPDLSRTAKVLAEQYRQNDEDLGLYLFLKDLYQPGCIVWRGSSFSGLGELGERMMRSAYPANYGEILRKQVVSHWLQNTSGIMQDADTLNMVRQMEQAAVDYPELACYWFGFTFAAVKELSVHGRSVESMAALFTELFRSPKNFYGVGGYEQLISAVTGAKLMGYLASFGHWGRLQTALERFGSAGEHEKFCYMLAALEAVGQAEGLDLSQFHGFYLYYGPAAPAYYVCRLQQGRLAYKGLNAVGAELVKSIEDCTLPRPMPIARLRQEMGKLMELTERLEQQLQNNPFLAEAGVYGNASVACYDLSGYFAYRLMGRSIPLGLAAVIEKN